MATIKYTIGSIRDIKQGIKAIIRGVFGVFEGWERIKRDFRFKYEARDWDIPIGPVSGKKGEIQHLTIQPQCWFRGEKFMANDSLKGMGTRITQILVGQRLQRPATGGGTLSIFFSQNAIGNGLVWDDCGPCLSICVSVQFIEDCVFDANVFGKALL